METDHSGDFLRDFGQKLVWKDFKELPPQIQTTIFLVLGVPIDPNSPPSQEEYQCACAILCNFQKMKLLRNKS